MGGSLLFPYYSVTVLDWKLQFVIFFTFFEQFLGMIDLVWLGVIFALANGREYFVCF